GGVEGSGRRGGGGGGWGWGGGEGGQAEGEMRRARPGNGALAAIDAEYALTAAGPAGAPGVTSATVAAVQTVMSAMAPWAAPQTYLNFTGASRGPASFWTPQAYHPLRRIQAAVDPAEPIP